MPRTREALALTHRYHDRSIGAAKAAQQQVESRFVRIDQADLVAGFRDFLTDAIALVRSAQRAQVVLADGYLRLAGRIELGSGFDIGPVKPDNIGFTMDGREIGEVFVASRARMFVGLKDGNPGAVLAETRTSVGRVAFFETMDAGQAELIHQARQADGIIGARVKSKGTCGACLAIDTGDIGSLRANGWPPFHPGCQCIAEPVFDVDERVHRPTGPQRFDALSHGEQNALLGPKAALIRSGAIDWKDLIDRQHFHEWDSVIKEAPTHSLVSDGIVSEMELEHAKQSVSGPPATGGSTS